MTSFISCGGIIHIIHQALHNISGITSFQLMLIRSNSMEYKKYGLLQVFSYDSRTRLPEFVLSGLKWDKKSFIYAAGKWDQVIASYSGKKFSVY